MNFVNGVIAEFKASKLWIAVAGLLAVLVAIPVLLSSHPDVTTTAAIPAPIPQPAGAALPVLSTAPQTSDAAVAGGGRDPFTPQHGAARAKSSAVAAVAGAASALAAAVAHPASSGATASSPKSIASVTPPASHSPATPSKPSTGVTRTPSVSPSPGIPNSQPLHRIPMGNTGLGNTGLGNTGVPALPPLKANQTFVVAASVNSDGGGLNAIDPLVRQAAVPNAQAPGLIELGVLRGGSAVAFAVAPGASVSGPGTCVPGPTDCEVLQLAVDTTGTPETVSQKRADGTSATASISITDIREQTYPGAAAAQKARAQVDRDGTAALATWTQPALSLFSWSASGGYLVDERDLGVGGGS